MYSISVWFAKFYFLFTQPWAATLRSSSPVGASWCIHSAPGGWCTLLSVLMLVCMGISWWTHSTPKIQNQNKWRIFLKKRKAIWIYIIFEKLERPEISNVLEELCLQFAEYIFGKIFEKTISIQLQQLFGGKYLWFTFQFRRNFWFSWQRYFYRNM